MSAVAAIWRFDGRPVREDIDRMTAALRMYGADGSDAWVEGPVALGHCRSILTPEDRTDRQPRTGAGGAMVLAADLRLDNREELAEALSMDPARLRGMPDSELLLAVLERWGEEGVERLHGGFAFAWWDGARRRLVCARDALGERGLFIHRTDRLFAVASMPKGLHALSDIPRALDERQIARGLLLLPGGNGTLFQNIELLRPGHLLVATDGGVTIRSHWTPAPANSVLPASEGEAVEQFRAILEQAVRSRLRAVGEIGSHLSSGMDSGTVTAITAKLLAAEGRRLTAYTSVPREGYEGRGLFGRHGDEGPGARAVAELYPNIDHRLVRLGDRTPLDGLDMHIQTLDRPPVNPCNTIWGDEIARQARQAGIRVMMTGQMGNMTISYHGRELFAELMLSGNPIRWGVEVFHAARRMPHGLRMAVGLTVLPFVPGPVWRAYERRRRGLGDQFRHTLISREFAEEIDYEALAREANWDLDYRYWTDGRAMRLAVLQRVDPAAHNMGSLAAFGVDHRDPTMDRRLVDFCLGLPTRYFLHRGVDKRLLKLAAKDLLPSSLINFKGRKGYQAVDWHEALTKARAELAEEVERLEASPTARRVLDLPRLRRLLADWPTGDWHSPEVTSAYRLALSRGVAMGRFVRRMEGGNQ